MKFVMILSTYISAEGTELPKLSLLPRHTPPASGALRKKRFYLKMNSVLNVLSSTEGFIREWYYDIKYQCREWEGVFKKNRITPLRIDYEDYKDDYGTLFKRIFSHIDIEPPADFVIS